MNPSEIIDSIILELENIHDPEELTRDELITKLQAILELIEES